MITRPIGRDFAPQELINFVKRLSWRDDLWGHLVCHDASSRQYEQVFRDEHLAVWLIGWMKGQDTGFHDHDLSYGAVTVVSGELIEERLTLAGEPARNHYCAGDAFSVSASDIHRVTHEGSTPAVSLHAYSPPLWRMGAYVIEPDGKLSRESISYAEELRPLEAGRA
jgi:predicted metal-dependent enzyme (double-stranded beta helix superfamily)